MASHNRLQDVSFILELAMQSNIPSTVLSDVRRSLPGMIAKRTGSIVNVSSMAAKVGMPGLAVYSASKAALESLTRTWAAEFAGTGVRVNSVSPGPPAPKVEIRRGEPRFSRSSRRRCSSGSLPPRRLLRRLSSSRPRARAISPARRLPSMADGPQSDTDAINEYAAELSQSRAITKFANGIRCDVRCVNDKDVIPWSRKCRFAQMPNLALPKSPRSNIISTVAHS